MATHVNWERFAPDVDYSKVTHIRLVTGQLPRQCVGLRYNPTERNEMAAMPTEDEMQERVKRLPRSMQEYITRLQRERDEAVLRAEDAKFETRKDNAGSKIFIENTIMDAGVPISKYADVRFHVGSDFRDQIRARVVTEQGLDWVELSTGDGAMITRGFASNVLRLRPDPYWRSPAWPQQP